MTNRLFRCETFEHAILTILYDSIALLGAEYGTLQLVTTGEELVIAAQRGLPKEFLQTFRLVRKGDGSVCGRALLLGESVVVPDVQIDPHFTAFRDVAKYRLLRAVQSTLIAGNGRQLGIVSTHFASVHEPSKIEMETLKAYGVVAAEQAFKMLGETPLTVMAIRMHDELYKGL